MTRSRVFISSVQKELENERIAAQEILWTDPFLKNHCDPVLYESEPASPKEATKECLEEIESCQYFTLIVGNEYGYAEGELSITHLEYRKAKQLGLPYFVFIKGARALDAKREQGVREKLLMEIEADKVKYKRFENYRDLQTELRAALVKQLKRDEGISPTSDENEIAEATIETASNFGKQPTSVLWNQLELSHIKTLVEKAEGLTGRQLTKSAMQQCLVSRGLLRPDSDTGELSASAAGVVLLAKDPTTAFPQCRILADTFHGAEQTSKPDDQEDIRLPMPAAIDRAVDFVMRNTRHPMRVVGLNRIKLDEYPVEALREALVNAVAHRRYEQDGQKILLKVFSDRVTISSPGLLPSPLKLADIRKGKYHPCSRNPSIAQGLSFFHRIEERGSGFGRMRDEMLNHGLDRPVLGTQDGYFEVTFYGPGDDLERLKVPANAGGV
ncbi:MAG TPA: ATP-dependent DNA helicase, partial [Planctomycetaceae bacterium]|nr:ATP-dependent DNA helicase [Planctomycetaceae bacterium]